MVIITCYFNPLHCKYRLKNYKLFRHYIQKVGLPLYTVELVIGDGGFELTNNDATVLKQLRCKSLMFQKERMLNILIDEIPKEHENVCWMDCDLIYLDDGWHDRIEEALEKYLVVQPYQYAVALPQCEIYEAANSTLSIYNTYGSGLIRRSFAYYNVKTRGTNPHDGHVGYVWAAKREFLQKHKLYDSIVTGCGDLFMAVAFFGTTYWVEMFPAVCDMNDKAFSHFFDWACPISREVRDNVGYTEDLLMHLWHGDIKDRNYLAHSKSLQLNDFDPTSDIVMSDNGCWEWNSDKPALHESLREMFGLQQQK